MGSGSLYGQSLLLCNEHNIRDNMAVFTSDEDTIGGGQEKYYNPGIAFVTAFAPGFFVHGLGHYYTGDYQTAYTLFGIELLSIGFTLNLIRILEEEEAEGSGFEFFAGYIMAPVLFLGSWIYDWVRAPTICRQKNEKNKHTVFYPYIKRNPIIGNQVGMIVSYRF